MFYFSFPLVYYRNAHNFPAHNFISPEYLHMKLIVCATHPGQCNGYSLCAYNLVKEVAERNPRDEIWWYGFQNVFGESSRNVRPLPSNVDVHDAMKLEVPLKQGFGEDMFAEYVAAKSPDVVLLYNDSVVVERFLSKLDDDRDRPYKIVVYQDLVYEHMKARFVKQLNEKVDRVLAFTPYWKEHMESQGVTTPVAVLRHGFDPTSKFPVPTELARRVFGISPGDFVILNLNRNQPRKRWDICIKAFAEFLSRHRGEPVRLLVGTAHQGAWDLFAIFERELGKRGMTLEEGRKHITVNNAPQQMSDADVNILMNCADIGISAADGEGFGLCNFEHAGIGRPQVVSHVGGAKDVFDDTNAVVCEPVMAYYVDSSRDGVGGEAQLIDYADMVHGMELYYSDPVLRKKHGEAARQKILGGAYRWSALADTLRAECLAAAGHDDCCVSIEDTVPDVPDVPDVPSDPISDEVKSIKEQIAALVSRLEGVQAQLHKGASQELEGDPVRPSTPVRVDESQVPS